MKFEFACDNCGGKIRLDEREIPLYTRIPDYIDSGENYILLKCPLCEYDNRIDKPTGF